ncbi:MAG: DEAD/DEAH box helicase [Candidatus Riflebacteria bacterium]|nr:DEAD/DEAH box helicase [Candidatus Riflebacteria bacterium]
MTTYFRHATNNTANETSHNHQTTRENGTHQPETERKPLNHHTTRNHVHMNTMPTNNVETTRNHTQQAAETRENTDRVETTAATVSVFAALHPDLQKGITRNGFTTPTPIQQKTIPAGINGRDLLASSQTGSGKTAAFLLPIMHRIITSRENEKRATGRITPRTRALILTPTRELAAQICQHFNDLATCTDLSCAAVFGGVSMLPQETAFRSGVDILVCCPGRLLDHMTRPYAKLPHLEYLVLDEADRMLDMGFLPDIRRVLKALPATQRQTFFFSATLPAPIVTLSKDMLNNPVSVDIERPQITATGIEHRAFRVNDNLKQELLINIIDQHQIRSAIIFTRTKHRAKRLASFLDRKNVPTDFINGNRSQLQRTKALEDFRNGKVRVLVATDIASRGIDVEAVSHVINFDVPHVVEDYVHRAGRTARANMTGYSYTLVSADEMYDFSQIERTMKTRIEQVKLENFDYNAKPNEALEVPLAQRIAEIRAYKAACRNRAAEKQSRRPGTPTNNTTSRNEPARRTATTRNDEPRRTSGTETRNAQPRHYSTRTNTTGNRSWQNNGTEQRPARTATHEQTETRTQNRNNEQPRPQKKNNSHLPDIF